jgi:hypothetical protein
MYNITVSWDNPQHKVYIRKGEIYMRKTLIGALLMIFPMMGTVAAVPSFNGPTGMILTPDTETLGQGGYSIGFNSSEYINTASINFGLANNIEIGVTRFDFDLSGDYNAINIKWKFASEGDGPALAFGIQDVIDERKQTPYLVASNTLNGGARIHYGLGGGTIDGLFCGFEKDFSRSTFLAEYVGDNFNVGMRFAIAQNVNINAGVLDKDNFYFGITLSE